MLLIIILITIGLSFGEYCIQVAANTDFEVLKGYYEHVKKFEHARIEKKGNIYLLRVGATNVRSELQTILPFIKRKFPDAYIKICDINEKYVVFPKPTREATRTPKQVAYATNDDVKELKKVVEDIRRELKEIKGKKGDSSLSLPQDWRNFLIVGIAIFALLFLFMLIMLILIFKNIRKANGDVMRVFLEMINALKILNLLNRGNIVRMENGKLMVWDEEERKWKVVK